jgi:hypothetical protein
VALTYFTLAELRALPDVSDNDKYPDARVTSVGEYVEATIERVVGTSFVARTWANEEHPGFAYRLIPQHPFPIAVSAITVDGVADAGLTYIREGSIWKVDRSSWSGYRVLLTYTAGYSTVVPPDVKEAALWATRDRLMSTVFSSAWSGRQTQMNTEQGTVQFVVAGEDRPFGLPAVDAVVVGWRDRLALYGF